MRKIIVTPAGRKEYLEILLPYLSRDKNKNHFEEWHLWRNTTVGSDLEYIDYLGMQYDWIKVITPNTRVHDNPIITINAFYPLDTTDENTVYLRLDDDIVWIEEDAIDKLFEFRLNNPEYLLIFGNIINNAICGHIHQRNGILGGRDGHEKYGTNVYDANNRVGWESIKYAEAVHRVFLKKNSRNYLSEYKIGYKWELWEYNHRFSINVCSWFGRDFKGVCEDVPGDEERYLTQVLPGKLKRMNVIYMQALFSHYAFYKQRSALDKTDILEKYKKLSGEI